MNSPPTHTQARILEDTEHAVVRGRALPVEPHASASPMAPHCTLRHSTTPPLCSTEHRNNKQTTFKQRVAHNPVEKEAEAQNKEGDDVRPTTGSRHAFLQEPGCTKYTHTVAEPHKGKQ
ncbi:hypothetical protein DQ04_12301020 [Trypanosoma grayi]|uniref:hypothetical protein n=1 Tax=Trypanosoma grayi TaxID=71804 RepID=UPI0004F42484|nr:hypothetical protein DQ04_12301020 [Trypanosoma grayi]KEG06774.1 hypothetical protein DQ04_12301020 [Trypanosoma grayi]